MQTFPRHTHGSDCQGCNERLKDAHPLIESFFHQIKDKYPDVHCSWVYRDMASQEEAFSTGKSKLHYPQSKHNLKPSLAVDIFQINDQGAAVFSREFCETVFNLSATLGFDLRWGGNFKTLGDFGHFELRGK